MHPLRHPRNAALVGILFVVIGVVYWAIPYFGGWHVDYAGHDDADHPRRGDGADGLCPRRGLVGRVIRIASGRTRHLS